MDRRPVILATALIVVSIAGQLLLAFLYLSPVQQYEHPPLVVMSPGGISNLRSLSGRPTGLSSRGSEPELDIVAVTPDVPSTGELALSSDAALIAAGSDVPRTDDAIGAPNRAAATLPAVGPVSPSDDSVASMMVPPQPARPQLAPALALAIAPEGASVPGEPASPEAGSPPAAQTDRRDEPRLPGVALADNLRVAHLADAVVAYVRGKDERLPRERVRTLDDGLRWRDVFTYHLEPDR